MLFTLPIAIVGYAVIANIVSAPARFAMTCLMTIGLYASVPPVLVWNSNNSAGHYKRATTSALQLAVANAGGFVASEFFHTFPGNSPLTATRFCSLNICGAPTVYIIHFQSGIYCVLTLHSFQLPQQ